MPWQKPLAQPGRAAHTGKQLSANHTVPGWFTRRRLCNILTYLDFFQWLDLAALTCDFL